MSNLTWQMTRRRIAGTEFVARTDYRSHDGSVRHYTILNADGSILGRVSSHSARLGRAAGYHEGFGSWTHRSESWSNLADAATALAERASVAI